MQEMEKMSDKPASTCAAAPYLMGEQDVLLGCVPDVPPRPPPLPPIGLRPKEALEVVLREALSRPPCAISFSGGRDSSALLALALDVARRLGLPEPAAFTLRYPGVKDADESSWQAQVIEHLRPSTWEVVEISALDGDVIGPVGSASLKSHGLLWPPALHLATGWLSKLAGVTIVTGEGGDEILGARRATALHILARALRRQRWDALSPSLVRQLLAGAAPETLRAALARRQMAKLGYLSWLRPSSRAIGMRDVARSVADEPWSWGEAVRSHIRSPALALGEANRSWLGASYQVRFIHPFLTSDFADALARDGGQLGYAGRSDAMRRLFGDLLPAAVLNRLSKARFNGVLHGPVARAFAMAWDGTGVDPDVVDVEVLRSMWLADPVPVGTTALLQSAWLASMPSMPTPLR
jgi:Asparagine synthase